MSIAGVTESMLCYAMVSSILEVLYKLSESRFDNVPTLDKIWVRLMS